MAQKNKTSKPKRKRKDSNKLQTPEVLPPDTVSSEGAQQNIPQLLDHTTMDSTSVVEISIMHNENYSAEIIRGIMNSDSFSRLMALKESGDLDGFLEAGKRHITDICRAIDALKTHTDKFAVLGMIRVGKILNEITAEGQKINFAVIEGYGINPINRRSMFILAEITGIIKLLLAKNNIPVITMPVQTWKKYCRIVSDKKKVDYYVNEVEYRFGKKFNTTDEADAFMIYLALKEISEKTCALTKTDIRIKEELRKILGEDK